MIIRRNQFIGLSLCFVLVALYLLVELTSVRFYSGYFMAVDTLKQVFGPPDEIHGSLLVYWDGASQVEIETSQGRVDRITVSLCD